MPIDCVELAKGFSPLLRDKGTIPPTTLILLTARLEFNPWEMDNPSPIDDAKQQRHPAFNKRTILLVFSLCALVDFAWSMFRGRSAAESAITAVLGVLGIGWYLLIMWGSSHNDPDRWVP